MKLLFATTNKGKVEETEEILGFDVDSVSFEVEEIQSLDPVEVAIHKAQNYYLEARKPLFVEELTLTFKTLKKFPGPYISDFFDILGNQGLVDLLRGRKDRRAVARTIIVYIDRKAKKHVFEGKVAGKIARKPRGRGFGWDPIFIPKGDTRTFGEMSFDDKNKYSMRAKALKKFKNFLVKGKQAR